jgi:hypothetical protein
MLEKPCLSQQIWDNLAIIVWVGHGFLQQLLGRRHDRLHVLFQLILDLIVAFGLLWGGELYATRLDRGGDILKHLERRHRQHMKQCEYWVRTQGHQTIISTHLQGILWFFCSKSHQDICHMVVDSRRLEEGHGLLHAHVLEQHFLRLLFLATSLESDHGEKNNQKTKCKRYQTVKNNKAPGHCAQVH